MLDQPEAADSAVDGDAPRAKRHDWRSTICLDLACPRIPAGHFGRLLGRGPNNEHCTMVEVLSAA